MGQKVPVRGFCPLASSSKGNAVYLQTHESKVLIDCGLSGKKIKESLAHLGVNVEELDAIFVTHEHIDHIRGLKILGVRMGIPIIANSETAKAIVESMGDCPKFQIFTTGEAFTFRDLEVQSFNVQHDAADPVMFTVKFDDVKLGFCTDLGMTTSVVRHHLQECDHLYLESNHEPSMVHSCSRPMVYKQRVLGKYGHLSNQGCAELVTDIYHSKLRSVTLGHLSEECNTPEVAHQVMSNTIQQAGIEVDLHIAPATAVGNPVLIHKYECEGVVIS